MLHFLLIGVAAFLWPTAAWRPRDDDGRTHRRDARPWSTSWRASTRRAGAAADRAGTGRSGRCPRARRDPLPRGPGARARPRRPGDQAARAAEARGDRRGATGARRAQRRRAGRVSGAARRRASPGRARSSFEQIFFAGRGHRPREVAGVRGQRALRGGAEPGLGSRRCCRAARETLPLDLVARDFGAAFAAALEKLPLGRMGGPGALGLRPASGARHGTHARALPPLDEVRAAVAREWENERRDGLARRELPGAARAATRS